MSALDPRELLLVPVGADKRPLIRWKQDGPLTREEARRWRPRPTYWARIIPPGQVVLDCDDGPPPASWPATLTQTTRRGAHLVFATDGRRVRQGRLDLDGRAVDVLAPGNTEIVSGPGRTWNRLPIAQLPGRLLLAIEWRPPEIVERGPVRHADRYIQAALQRAAEVVAAAPAGQRNRTLNSETWALARLDVGHGDVFAAMLPAALSAGLDRAEAEATIRSAMRRRAIA